MAKEGKEKAAKNYTIRQEVVVIEKISETI